MRCVRYLRQISILALLLSHCFVYIACTLNILNILTKKNKCTEMHNQREIIYSPKYLFYLNVLCIINNLLYTLFKLIHIKFVLIGFNLDTIPAD